MPKPMPDTPESSASRVRPRVRPEGYFEPRQGTGESSASPVPLSYGGDALKEPSAGRTASASRQCVPGRF